MYFELFWGFYVSVMYIEIIRFYCVMWYLGFGLIEKSKEYELMGEERI